MATQPVDEQRPEFGLVDSFGRFVRENAIYLLDIVGLISVALKSSKHLLRANRRRIFYPLFMRQLYNTGVRALYINAVIAAFIGALLMSRLFQYIGNDLLSEQYGYLFVLVVFRELGPLISGIILIARSATAITSEIGYLRVTREFQVLYSLGINPVYMFLLPVFFAFPISLLLMFVYFDVVCIISAYVVIAVSDNNPVSFLTFVLSILDQITINEIAINAVKAILGGIVIGVISIHFGARATDSFDEVSSAISNSTTSQLMAFFLINVGLSMLAYTQ